MGWGDWRSGSRGAWAGVGEGWEDRAERRCVWRLLVGGMVGGEMGVSGMGWDILGSFAGGGGGGGGAGRC